MNLTPTPSTPALLGQFYAVLRQAIWEAIHVENYSVGPVAIWPVSVSLSCRSCDVKAVATMQLEKWLAFRQLLREQAFKCKCGGILTDGSALIKLAPPGGLTNRQSILDLR